MLMECCHYLQVWDATQVLSANSDLVCLVHNRCAMFYMPLLIFPRPAVMSQSKDNWQFMILLFHLMSRRGGFQATAWPRLRHKHNSHSFRKCVFYDVYSRIYKDLHMHLWQWAEYEIKLYIIKCFQALLLHENSCL